MTSGPSIVAERPAARPGTVSVARALGSSTRAGIYAHLQKSEAALTVREVASAFDLHPNVARTHLETLADAGLVGVGLRKHPGGGRPAKLYEARAGITGDTNVADRGLAGPGASAGLLVRLLAELALDRPITAGTVPGSQETREGRARDIAAAEARRLVSAAVDAPHTSDRTLEDITATALRALRPHVADAKVVKAGRDWVDVAGLSGTFALLAGSHPELAEALERGLLYGALGAAGVSAALSDAGETPGRGRVLRARTTAQASSRPAIEPASSVDARGEQHESGVVRAMRAVTALGAGEVLEVIAEGPGSPMKFARWADRAGHQLLGVERATDPNGRPGIRMLIRKGS